MAKLFEALTIRRTQLPNRIVVSPMCQYSAINGVPTEWHLVHLGSRAVGGAGIVMTEATAVEAIGRISPECTGIWNDEQARAWKRIAAFVREQGSVPAIQLAHAGRKASTPSPWLAKGRKFVTIDQGGWQPVGPSPLPFAEDHAVPRQLSADEIRRIPELFEAAARRSLEAGFEIVEVHAAHGYLFHEFLSPRSNQRTDEFGGSFDNRTRILVETVKRVRAFWPQDKPVFVRLSASDWIEGGWTLPDTVKLVGLLKAVGADLIDTSSGGNEAVAPIPGNTPGYQVPFSDTIRREAGIATGAVGMVTDAHQAEAILTQGQADLIFLAREMLRDPYWPRRAAKELGAEFRLPKQYGRS